jgi:hypothetical protein
MIGTLSSDILEHQFGPTELEVLQQDKSQRIIATKAVGSGQILELSQIRFCPEGVGVFTAIHQKILAGSSMGKTFREQGMAFERQVHAVYRCEQQDVPAIFSKRFGTSEGRLTVIDVSILAGPHRTPYADILEIYSPEVAWNLTDAAMDSEVADRVHTFGKTLATLGNNP